MDKGMSEIKPKLKIRKHMFGTNIIGFELSRSFLNKWCSMDYGTDGTDYTITSDWTFGEDNQSWAWNNSVVIDVVQSYWIRKRVIIEDRCGSKIYLDWEEVEYGLIQEGVI